MCIFSVILLFFTLLITCISMDDNSIKLLSTLSECSYSYTIKNLLTNNSNSLPSSVFHYQPIDPSNITLQLVNIAFGTTGTRSVFQSDLKQYNNSGCHWIECYPEDNTNIVNKLPKHFDIIRECIDGTIIGRQCHSDYWLNELYVLLLELITSNITILADTPIIYLFSELRNLIPNLIIKHTLRNPYIWIIKRIAEHPKGDLICNNNDNSNNNNPFNILQCIYNSKYIQDNVISTVSFIGMDLEAANNYLNGEFIPYNINNKIKEVGKAYAKYNSYIMLHTDQKYYQPICVWDH